MSMPTPIPAYTLMRTQYMYGGVHLFLPSINRGSTYFFPEAFHLIDYSTGPPHISTSPKNSFSEKKLN